MQAATKSVFFFLNECTKDTTAHLRFLKCSSSEAYIPESLLILNRAGVHIGLVPVDRSLICAKHRHELGIQWKRSKRKCCHPLHIDQFSGTVARGLTYLQSQELWINLNAHVPIGSGKMSLNIQS